VDEDQECYRQRGEGCWRSRSTHPFRPSGLLSADGPVSMPSTEMSASTEMGAWFGEVSTEWVAGNAYGSFYLGGREKGSYYKPPYPWYLVDTPNCWAGNQNK